MRIGIIGVGNIGRSLARNLGRSGHDVKVANSRGPQTIPADVLTEGVRAVTVAEAAADVDALILSIPLSSIPRIAPAVAGLASSVTVIDTSNYYPLRDGEDLLQPGRVESEWVIGQLGRPVAKAWNSIGSASLAEKGRPSGAADRVALPVAADRPQDRELAMALVDDSGFDAYDAGPIAQSWRQQPGTPCYGTDLTLDELPGALAAADPERAPRRRDLIVAAIQEKVGDSTTNPSSDWSVALARLINM